MKKRKIISLLMFLFCLNCNSQTIKILTFESLKKELLPFLINNKDIMDNEIEDYRSGKKQISIVGLQNNYFKGDLKDGIYRFSQTRTHSRVYFVIIEKNNFTILDLSSRDGLDLAIKNTLDFCERSKYCEEITNDYVSREIRIYYSKNKNPNVGTDVNCLYGIKVTKKLP